MRKLFFGLAALSLTAAIATPAFAPTGCSPCTRHIAVETAPPPATIGHCLSDAGLKKRCVAAWDRCAGQPAKLRDRTCLGAWRACCDEAR